jgi:uncharacterized protein
MRRLMEQFFGYIQQIVIDPEGEFASLREKFAFVLASAERDDDGKLVGDIEADPNTADALALMTLKTRASIIIDISELSVPNRQRYVARFVEALINAPRDLWHPLIVWVDEAHDYAPESGHGHKAPTDEESSLNALRDLSSKGRKRGFCAILSTQRLAKFSKDVAAELKNYMIGNTNLDIDQSRASEILGFTSGKEGQKQTHDLRFLEPGTFWASGPIFSSELKQVKVGPVLTHHPEAEEAGRVYIPPPTPEEVKPALAEFATIPEVKRRKLDELRELRTRDREHLNMIQSLNAKLRNAELRLSEGAISPDKLREVQEEYFSRGQAKTISEYNQTFTQMSDTIVRTRTALAGVGSEAQAIKGITDKFLAEKVPDFPKVAKLQLTDFPKVVRVPTPMPAVPKIENIVEVGPDVVEDDHLKAGVLKMLGATAMFYPNPADIQQVAAFSGFAQGSSTWRDYLSQLKSRGLVIQSGDSLTATQAGIDRLGGKIPKLPTDADSMYDLWAPKMKAGNAKMLKILMDAYPSTLSKEALGEQSGFPSAGSTFRDYFGRLRGMKLVEVDSATGEVRASKFLMGGEV